MNFESDFWKEEKTEAQRKAELENPQMQAMVSLDFGKKSGAVYGSMEVRYPCVKRTIYFEEDTESPDGIRWEHDDRLDEVCYPTHGRAMRLRFKTDKKDMGNVFLHGSCIERAANAELTVQSIFHNGQEVSRSVAPLAESEKTFEARVQAQKRVLRLLHILASVVDCVPTGQAARWIVRNLHDREGALSKREKLALRKERIRG